MLAPVKTPMEDPGLSSSITDLFFAWSPAGLGVSVSFASFQGWFNDWDPILQGAVFILTIISLIISFFLAKKNR